MVLFLMLMHQNVGIMVGYLELVLRYVHLVHLKLLVLPKLTILRTLFLLDCLLLVSLVQRIHFGLLLTTVKVLVELLVILTSPLLQQQRLDLEVLGNLVVLLNVLLMLRRQMVSSELVVLQVHYSVYFILLLVLSESLELVRSLLLQQHMLVLDLLRNSVVQQSLLHGIHWKGRCSSPLQELEQKPLLQIHQKKERKFVFLAMLSQYSLYQNIQDTVLSRLLEKVLLQQRNHLLALDPVSYTHLTLPTNREV